MSGISTPDESQRGAKRRRSFSQDFYRNGDERLQYAYDDEDSHSEAGRSFHTPDAGSDDEEEPQRKAPVRPRTLNYVPVMTLQGHKAGVAAVKFSPDGKWIASCSADATIKIWDAHTGELSQTLEGHLAGISTISWSPDSRYLASGSDDKIIRLWDLTTGKSLPSPLIGHHNYVYSLAFSPKGNMIVSGSYDEAVFLWDVRTARLMRSLPAHSDPVSGTDFVRDGTLIASCSSDGLIRIWDTSTGQCLKTLVHEDNAPVTSVKFSPNGKQVLAATLDSCVRLWDYVNGRCLKTYQGHKNEKFSVNAAFGTYGVLQEHVDLEERGDRIGEQKWAFTICGSEDGRVYLWDVNSKETLQVLRGHDGVVLGVDVGLVDQTIVTCGVDKKVKVWKRMPEMPSINGNGNGHLNVAATPKLEPPSEDERMVDSDT